MWPEWVIAAITLVYAYFSFWQWQEIGRQARAAEKTLTVITNQRDDARDNAERQLRAYISITTASVTIPQSPTPRPPRYPGEITISQAGQGNVAATVKISFKNFGQTPAYNVRLGVSVGAGDYSRCNLMSTQPHEPWGIVGPAMEIHLPAKPFILNSQAKDRIAHNKAAIWVSGRIDYVDAFKKDRRTNFQLRYRDGFLQGELDMVPDAEGNDST